MRQVERRSLHKKGRKRGGKKDTDGTWVKRKPTRRDKSTDLGGEGPI